MTHNCSIKINDTYVVHVKKVIDIKFKEFYKVIVCRRNGIIKETLTTSEVSQITPLVKAMIDTYKYSK